MCGSSGFALSAAQVDRRIKAVATVVMYDIARISAEGRQGSLTTEERGAVLDAIAEQRYADFEAHAPALTLRGTPIGFDENTDPVGREFGEFHSTPRGYHPNSITQFTLTSGMSLMNFPLLSKTEWISPRPILFVVGENAHSRYFSEDAYELAAEPKEFHVVPNAGHVDLYDRTDLIPFDNLEEFFSKNLA
ncbi:alpha/beta hydrolase [Streptomyces sp. NPDC048252]|uniref:alpha/beta hydrolase n=1 Tax=Streptomyces sp. NPDC048252 TaxID=3154612 RepID=UPI0034160832